MWWNFKHYVLFRLWIWRPSSFRIQLQSLPNVMDLVVEVNGRRRLKKSYYREKNKRKICKNYKKCPKNEIHVLFLTIINLNFKFYPGNFHRLITYFNNISNTIRTYTSEDCCKSVFWGEIKSASAQDFPVRLKNTVNE